MLRLPSPLVRPLPQLVALLPPLALAAAALVVAGFQLDRGAAATTAFFGWLALGVLAPLALLPAAPRALAPAATLAVAVALLGLPHLGVLRPAATMALLGAALVAFAVSARRTPRGLGAWLALALAAQLTAAANRLFLAPTAAVTAGALLALPTLAALALDRLDRGGPGGGQRATVAALVAFLAGPGWTPAGVLGLALAAGVDRALAARPALRPAAVALAAAAPLAFGAEPAWLALALTALAALAVGAPAASARAATGLLAALALFATLAGTLPWLRPAPLSTLLAGLAVPGGPVIERPLESQPAVLSASSPRYETLLGGEPVRVLVIDSYLTRAVELPCATLLARVRLEAPGEVREADLEVGRDSAEWAAERPDVAAALACPAPSPWSSWLPAAGRFFGHHYRARLRLDPPLPVVRLVIDRATDLPDATTLALFHVATER